MADRIWVAVRLDLVTRLDACNKRYMIDGSVIYFLDLTIRLMTNTVMVIDESSNNINQFEYADPKFPDNLYEFLDIRSDG